MTGRTRIPEQVIKSPGRPRCMYLTDPMPTAQCKQAYNRVGPHSSLGYRPPSCLWSPTRRSSD